MTEFSRLALIPARGGSKGIPNKNLQYVGNKTLLERAIISAKQSNMFSEICVSTDHDVIANLARFNGASVPFIRPSHISSDTSLGIEVINHAVNFYSAQGITFSSITLLQPTSPFRDAKDISSALSLFESSNFESLISTLDVTHMQPSTLYQASPSREEAQLYNLYSLDKDYRVAKGTLRQDFQTLHWRNGAIYIMKPENLQHHPVLLKEPIGGYHMNWLKSINIDNFQDLEKARQISELLNV